MRLFPRRGVGHRIRQEQDHARDQIEQSRAARRRVDAKQPEVDRANRLLGFYSERNGFADAFEEMLAPREGGRGHEARS